jgi:hypothetical protein
MKKQRETYRVHNQDRNMRLDELGLGDHHAMR